MRKKVLVTGGAVGLGAAVVEEFAKKGFDVAFTYHKSEKEAHELEIRIREEYGVDVQSYQLDLECDEEIDNFIETIGEIDVLINNAACNDDYSLFDKDREAFLRTYKVNALAPFFLSRGLFQVLKKRSGNIVNIASTNGIDTMYPESVDYDASKAALINMTSNLAKAFRPHVRVNAVAPGWIDTKNTEDMEMKFRKREEDNILLGRFARPEEIAKIVYFVASEEAAYLNGAIIRVDGGSRYGNR